MKLALFNGSPRRTKSNTRIILDKLAEGFVEAGGSNDFSLHYLARTKETGDHLKALADAATIIIAHPLYTDSMPGVVKNFIDALPELNSTQLAGKKMGFIVHSGFSESIHSTFVAKYHQRLTKRLSCEYLGTVIKPGSEGVRLMPDQMNAKLFTALKTFGRNLVKGEKFDQEVVESMQKRKKYSPLGLLAFRIFNKLGFANSYWNSNLKKHNAYEKRFDKPYEPEK